MQIEYEISEQDFFDAQKLAIRKHPSIRVRLMSRILLFWGLILVFGVVWPMFLRGFVWNRGSLTVLLFVLFFFGSPWFVKQIQKRAYRKSISMQGPRTMVVDETGVSFTGANFSSQLKWPFFVKFAEDDKTFVLYQNNQIFHIIPKRQLSPQQIAELREAFTQHIARKK